MRRTILFEEEVDNIKEAKHAVPYGEKKKHRTLRGLVQVGDSVANDSLVLSPTEMKVTGTPEATPVYTVKTCHNDHQVFTFRVLAVIYPRCIGYQDSDYRAWMFREDRGHSKTMYVLTASIPASASFWGFWPPSRVSRENLAYTKSSGHVSGL